MTPVKVLEVLRFYQQELKIMGYRPERLEGEVLRESMVPGHDDDRCVRHALAMCEVAQEFVLAEPPRIEKAMRWLGFIQGTLFCMGIYNIEDMKGHNRPDESKGDV